MRKRLLFVLNPIAGIGKKGGLPGLIDSCLDKEKFDPVIYIWDNVDALDRDIEVYMEQGVDALVAVGGDGTFNRLINAAFPGIDQFGLIPQGSGNGLARCLHIPLDPRSALMQLNRGESRPMDLGKFNDRLFANVAGLGFDAQVAMRFEQHGQRGLKGYVRATLNSFRNASEFAYERPDVAKQAPQRAFILGIANGNQWGSDLYLNASSRPDDGKLEFVHISKPGPVGAITAMRALRSGRKHDRINIESSADWKINLPKPVPFHTDGETGMIEGELHVSCLPGAITLVN